MSASGRCCRKSLLGGNEQGFLKLLVGFVRSDVRDHIASQKNDHGPSYRHYRASQRRGSPKFTICEIFGVVRFSTFSTASVKPGQLRDLKRASACAHLAGGGYPARSHLRGSCQASSMEQGLGERGSPDFSSTKIPSRARRVRFVRTRRR